MTVRHSGQVHMLHQGRRHEWWENSVNGKHSSIPRHTEISRN